MDLLKCIYDRVYCQSEIYASIRRNLSLISTINCIQDYTIQYSSSNKKRKEKVHTDKKDK